MDGAPCEPQDLAVTYQQLKSLYARGRYRDTWDQAVQYWGAPTQWRAAEQLILGARLASQLGLSRTADAFTLSAHRRHGADPQVQYFYARYLLARRGPLAALDYIRPFGEQLGDDVKLQSDWLLLYAELYIAYRDWETARHFIDRARAVDSSNAWLSVVAAELLERQDDYKGAVAELEALALSDTPYRPALQSVAHLYVLLGREGDAVTLLKKGCEAFQCVGVFWALQEMLRERGEAELAESYLARARSCIPQGPWRIDARLVYAEFEQHYERGRYQEALAALQTMPFGFTRTVADNLQKNGFDAARRKLAVPFIRQHHMTCAPATFTAIALYWGHEFDHLDVAEKICYDGTPATTERKWIAELGWPVHEFELNLDTIRQLVDRGIPVGFATVEPGNAHMQAICGYDLCRGVYLMRDPFSARTGEILIEGAHQHYQSTGPRCMVYVPPEKKALLDGIELPAAELYERYYVLQQSLEQNLREHAVRVAEEIETASPSHRLALWSRRSIAAYDRDLNALLDTTEALIKLYPEDLNLLCSKASLLGELGRNKEKVEFLRGRIDSGVQHPYLLQALVDELRFDNRQDHETLPLLDGILRQRPWDARALSAKAYVLWNTQQFDRAFELYRFAACLEDKHEGYAEVYCRAGRMLGRRDEAMRFVERRQEKLGILSGDPSVTLARVYLELDRHGDAQKITEAALVQHPQNAWLINEALDLYVRVRQFDKAQSLLECSETVLSRANYLDRCASIARERGERDASMAFYEQLLELNPYHAGAIEALVYAHNEHSGLVSSLSFLQRHLDANPHDYFLRGIKLNLLSDLPNSERRAELEQMAQYFNSDNRVLLEASRSACHAGEYLEAQRYVDEALAINRHDTEAMMLSGYIAAQCRDFSLAKSRFRAVIEFNVDADGVFFRFLNCYSGYKGKCEALAFIHQQLLNQVTNGNGLLEFMDLAPRYMPEEQVQALLVLACDERPDLWQSWCALAEFYDSRGKSDQALRAIDEGVKRFPLLPRVWLVRARARKAAKDLVGAEADLRKALEINPRWIRAITELAEVLEASGRNVEALELIDAALETMPQEGVLLGYKADAAWQRGSQEAAIDFLLRAVEKMPGYDWGWRRLHQWCAEIGQPDRVLQHAEKLASENEHIPVLWSRCHDECRDVDKKLAYIRRALELRPDNEDYIIDECNVLLDKGELKAVRARIDASNWQGERPSALSLYEAWLHWRLGETELAVRKMVAVTERDPRHIAAWRYLASWYQVLGNIDQGHVSARRCVELQPHSPGILTDTSQYLLRIEWPEDIREVRMDEAREYAERALALDPSDPVLQVHLLDLYIDDEKFDEAGKLLATLGDGVLSPYVNARRMHCFLQRDDVASAMAVYEKMLSSQDANTWVVTRGVNLAVQYKCFEDVSATLDKLITDGSAAAITGAAWALVRLEQELSGRELSKALFGFRKHELYWPAAMEFIMTSEHVAEQLKGDLYTRHRKQFVEISLLRPAAMWFFARRQDWDSAKKFGKKISVLPGNSMASLYLYNFSLRLSKKWGAAAAVIRQAMQCERDHTYSNILLWRDMDAAFMGQLNHYSLAEIDIEELTPLEKIGFDYLEQMKAMIEIPLHQNFSRYREEFSRIKRKHPSLYMEGAVLSLRSKLRRAIVNSMPGSFWYRVFWHFRLLTVV